MTTENPSAPVFSPSRTIRRKWKVLAAGAGLLLGTLTAGSHAENLIVNGGFETGNFKGWTVTPAANFSDFGVGSLMQINQVGQGATLFGSPLNSAPFAVFPSSGKYAAYYGAVGNQFDAISQTIHTFSGRLGEYRVSFRLQSAGPPPNFFPPRFQAIWDGRVIYDTTNTPAGPYQQLSFKESASSSKTILTLQGLQSPGWYFLDDVSVELVGKFANLSGLTPNQSAVAGALDRANNDHRANALFHFIDSQGVDKLPGLFDRIAPDELTSMFAMSTAYAQVQSLNLQRRTEDIRDHASGFSAANLAIDGNGPSYSGGFGITAGVAGPNGSGNDGKESKEVKEVAPQESRWGAFLSGTGEWVNVSGTDNARGYDLTSGGFTLGVDYKVCPNFAIGLAAGYTGTTADLTDHGRVLTNGGKLGMYATTFVGGWYADVAGFGGYNSYDTRRAGLQGEARGDTHGGEVDALFGTGYDFKAGGLTFGPTASFNYTYAGTNAFTEHGSLVPLSIHGGNADSLRTALGLKASYDCKLGSILIKPEIRAAWQHEYGDSAYALDSSFANGAGGSFTVNGPQFGRDSALIGAGFAIQCSARCSTYFYYDGELGRKNYQSNSVTGGLRLTF